MSHIIAAVLFTGLVFYIAALYESAQLALLGCCMAGLVLASSALVVYRLWAVEVKLSGAFALAEANQPFSVPFVVRAKRPMLGKARLLVQMEVRRLPGGRASRTWVELEAPHAGEMHVRRLLHLRCAGGYEYRMRRVRVYDWTGLLFLGRRVTGRQVTHLLPAVHEVPLKISASVRGFFGEAEVYDDVRGGHDASETFRIREYIPGDRLQNIHWKLTAKTGELMVREHSQPKGCPIVLLLGAQDGRERDEQFDRFLQIAASLSFALMDAECPHIVSWYDSGEERAVRTRVDDEADFYEWQLYYMESASAKKDVYENIEECYMQAYRSQPLLHRLRLDADLKLYVDGAPVYAFAKNGDTAKELEALELYI